MSSTHNSEDAIIPVRIPKKDWAEIMKIAKRRGSSGATVLRYYVKLGLKSCHMDNEEMLDILIRFLKDNKELMTPETVQRLQKYLERIGHDVEDKH